MDYLTDLAQPNDGSKRCTPRIIRGRTPCKQDGPSNSAGIALSTTGNIVAVDTEDYYVANNGNTETLSERISERANIHALYGGAYGDNAANNLGLQYRISDSKASPKYGGSSGGGEVDNTAQPKENTGYKPNREDFDYFLRLAGGKTALPKHVTNVSKLKFADVYDPAAPGASRCNRVTYYLPGGESMDGYDLSNGGANTDEKGIGLTPTDVYICYIIPTGTYIAPGGHMTSDLLTIKPEDGWHVQTQTEANPDPNASVKSIKKAVKVTVFVEGNLRFEGNPGGDLVANSENAVTAVDVGSFLSFIVSGNITIDPNVGVNLPNPNDPAICPGGVNNCAKLLTCWEKQSANLPEFGSGNNTNYWAGTSGIAADNNQYRSAVGSLEGIFIANGNLTIERFEDLSQCGQRIGGLQQVWTDKRFIGQGVFAAWGTSNFLRDFNQRDRGCQDDTHGVYNNRVPAETFIYRPDLVRNIPFWMRQSKTIYQDITGKYNN